jgi:gliding motility-associated-like protein
MKKITGILLLVFGIFYSGKIVSQSMNCATATQITLTSGTACVNGTNVGAITDNTLYGACNASPVDMVWYTYVTSGSNNTFTITPGTLQNAEIVIYQGNCPASGGALQNCVTATGSNPINTSWGMTAGVQVWIGIASTSLNDGTFTFCVKSNPPVAGAGNTCAQAIPICTTPFVQNTVPSNSSGQSPSCFGSAPQQDIFIKFTVTQAGSLGWTATVSNSTTEFDWCLWDITAGCPGTEVCCNYNYAGGSSAGFGMQNGGGNAACGTNAFGTTGNEFCPRMNVICGHVYAIQISNYSLDNTGFTLNFTNSTCQINSNAAFSATPALICGASLTAAITNTSTGACAETWTFGDGSATYTGTAPPNHTYNTPGTYPITATIAGACPSTVTHFVQLLAPLSATVASTNTGCGAGCTGTGSVTAVTGGNGVYTYVWNPGGNTTNNVSALCAGTYTATVSNALCGTSVSQVINVLSSGSATMAVNSAAICSGANATLIANGCATYTWSPATGLSSVSGATVTANPTVTTVYTITGANGSCTTSATSTVTVTTTPTVTVNSGTICNGGTLVLSANGAATYAWSPPGGLTATTGANVTANPAATTVYTVTGTTGTCTSTAASTVTVVTNPTITVNTSTICLGQQTATLTANGATTYTWSPAAGLSSPNGTTVTATPAATTNYTITGTVGTCSAVGTTTVTVNATPTVTVNSGTICNGGSLALNANGATTYAWSPPGGLTATTGANVTANPAATTIYTVTGTSNTCTSTATSTVSVVTNPTITVNTATICAGQQTATLTANGATTYAWSPSATLSSPNGTTVTATPATTTIYTITGTVGTCTAVGTTTVTVNTPPVINVNTGTICIGQTTANLTAGGAATYSWIPSAGLNATNIPSVVANPNTTTGYTVVGVDGNGCFNFATTTVTVNSLPPVAVSSTVICNGGSASLAASGAVTYTWTPIAGLSSANGSPVTAGPAATTVYSVTGTDANGCTNIDSATVTVITNPVIGVTTSTICVGQQTATLTANGASTYVWSPATGLSSTNGTTVTATPATTTNYTVTGTIGTCTAVGTTTVTVNPLPIPTIGSNSPVCLNQTLNLNAGAATTYTWAGPNSFASTQQNPSITGITAVAAGIYTVTATDANTCVGKSTINVVINPLPTVTAIGSTVCLNGTITLTGGGGVSYSWSGQAGAYTSNTQSPGIPNATAAMAGTYVVTVTDGNGCVNANVAQVVVNSLPTIVANSASICQNSITNLSASGANTYVWSPPTGLNTSVGANVSAGPNVTTGYTVTGTDVNNCQSTTTLTVSVTPAPLVTVAPLITSGCAPVCVTFSNTAAGVGAFSWNFGDGNTSTLITPSNCFLGKGTFTVSLTVTDNNGCIGSATASVIVYPVPHADFSASPQPTTILDNQIHFTDLSTLAIINSYSWTLGNNTSSIVQNPICLYADTGMYPVELFVVSDHGCRDSMIKYIRIDEDFELFVPNAFSPNGDGVNDIFYAKGEGVRDFKMYIYDRWGNITFTSDDIFKGWDGHLQGKGNGIVQEDVYTWKIQCKTPKGERKQLSGHVSLIK